MLYSGKYEVINQLGRGSMGTVFKVRHTVLETILALKVLPHHFTENEDLVKRFYREARVMARLNHPNIARVIDVQKDEELGLHYFVMEYIEGLTLRDHFRQSRHLPVIEVLDISRSVASALNYAHNFNPPVIHRDIKPTNIMVEQATHRYVVMDFGIAKELDESEATRAGTILGTLKYCPPEQMRHESLDGAADVYALGMVMYELLTGVHLLSGLQESDLLRRVLEPEEFKPQFPPNTLPEITEIIRKAIYKDRSKRYRRMDELLRDVEACCAMLDENETTLISATRVSHAASGDELDQLESQIKRLSEERERRVVARLQAQVDQVREHAVQELAPELAEDIFQRAQEHEHAARLAVQKVNFEQARESFQQAESLFQEAGEIARAERLVRNAARARDQTLAARQEADRYGAGERAGTFYGKALALQAQADELWTIQSYREAGDVYEEACSLFEASQEQAYKLLQEQDAKLSKAQVRTACEAADLERAQELASKTYKAACHAEQRADVAYSQEEYAQARELYSNALRHFEQSRTEAVKTREFQCSKALDERAKAALEQEQTEALGGAEHTEFAAAVALLDRGDEALEAKEPQAAEHAFVEAAARFASVRTHIEADNWRQRLVPVNKKVLDLLGDLRSASNSGNWVERLEAFEGRHKAAESSVAQNHFEHAMASLEMLVKDCETALADISRQQVRDEADAAFRELLDNRSAAQSARRWAEAAWAQADQLAALADKAWQAEDFAPFVSAAKQATAAYVEATAAAKVEQRLATETDAAYDVAMASRRSAESERSKEHAATAFAAAVALFDRAEHMRTERQWQQSRETFELAEQAFREAAAEAGRRQSRKLAEQSAAQARDAKEGAERAGAAALAQNEYREALREYEGAEHDLAHEDSAKAQQRFKQAHGLFMQAQVEALARQADQERTQTLLIREQLQTRGYRGGGQKDAQKLIDQGDKLHKKGESERAAEQYRKAGQLYTHILEHHAASDTLPPPQVRPKPAERPVGFNRWVPAGLGLGLAFAGGVYFFSRTSSTITPTPEIVQQPTPVRSDWTISAWSPSNLDITTEAGQSTVFSVQVSDTALQSVHTEWFIDDVKTAEGLEWTYKAENVGATAGAQRLRVVVSDVSGRSIEKVWRIRVQSGNRPPAIASKRPAASELELVFGANQDFSLEATDPDNAGTLKYRWYHDDRPLAETAQLSFTPTAEGRHTITAEVSDPAGLSVRTTWNVNVKQAPKPTLPALEIAVAEPAVTGSSAIIVVPGQPQRFRVEARGEKIDNLIFSWTLDGKSVGTGAEWRYETQQQSNARLKPVQLKVVVAAADGRKAEHVWRLETKAPAKAPQIVGSSPARGQDLRLEPGAGSQFMVDARPSAGGEALHFRWLLDGKEVGSAREWTFAGAEAPGKHTVEVQVSASDDAPTATRSWTVTVAKALEPPGLTQATPNAGQVNADRNVELNFKVKAAGGESDGLQYRWSVDGSTSATNSTGRFKLRVATLEPGSHEVTAAAVTRDGQTGPARSWTVNVAAPTAVPTAAPTVASAPTPAPTTAPTEPVAITKSDVSAWLEKYRKAWAARDVNALVALGEVGRGSAERLQTVLSSYQQFDVELSNVTINVDGDKATASFQRVDNIDGKTMPQPDRKTVTLKRSPDGSIIRTP